MTEIRKKMWPESCERVFSGDKIVGYVGKTKDWAASTKEEIDKYGYKIISLL